MLPLAPGHRPRRSLPARAALVLALCLGFATPGPGPALAEEPPDEGDCPTVSVSPEEQKQGLDAVPIAIKEGMILDQEALLVLRRLLPAEIWRHREVFFFEGMRMQIGYCHRRYLDAPFYRDATQRFRGQAKLDGDGNLTNYTAGVPFPADSIDSDAKDAGLRWAWNMQMRYRGAGHRGKFRFVDLASGLGGDLSFEGKFFFLQTRHRADLPDDDYTVEDSESMVFASGGVFDKPFDARHLAWRQFRSLAANTDYEEPDDVFVYVPTMRKTRRSATNWLDGVFFPRYSASGDAGGGGIAMGSQLGGGFSAINPTAGQSIAASEDSGKGWTGLAIRPNAYVWRVREVRDVLAPINATRPGWPQEDERNFGTSGLSFASDTWDVRRAVVLEGLLKERGRDVKSIVVYLDYLTRTPMYWITRTSKRRHLEVGILVHRYSADIDKYPDWPGGHPSNVLEPVAASFFNAISGTGGWRRESYDMVSLPFDKDSRRRMTSSDHLGRGH
ncbi:MAG: DUF1329 domain-containing protein [Myxococcota bacterium]